MQIYEFSPILYHLSCYLFAYLEGNFKVLRIFVRYKSEKYGE